MVKHRVKLAQLAVNTVKKGKYGGRRLLIIKNYPGQMLLYFNFINYSLVKINVRGTPKHTNFNI